MADDINVNKISDKHARRAEQIRDKLEKQGMGQDQAAQEALSMAVEELGEGAGGANSAGESPKHANYQGGRTGSDKDFQTG